MCALVRVSSKSDTNRSYVGVKTRMAGNIIWFGMESCTVLDFCVHREQTAAAIQALVENMNTKHACIHPSIHPSVVFVRLHLLSVSLHFGDTLSFIGRHSLRQNNKKLLTNHHQPHNSTNDFFSSLVSCVSTVFVYRNATFYWNNIVVNFC